MVLSDRIYTVEDYMKLDDDRQYELIGGKLFLVPSPSTKHQRIKLKICKLISDFVEVNQLGEVFDAPMDVVLDSQIIQPDILYISKDRSSIIGDLNIQGAPDLVIEILSPSTAVHDKKKKSQLYLKHGVKEYWLVDIEVKFVDVYVASEKEWRWIGAFDHEDVLTTALLPGMEINLGEVFKGLK
jgi:Uma2 family endonuclease